MIEGLSRFEGRSSLRTWIFGILIHKAKDRGVREKRHTTFSAFESYEDEHDEAIDHSRFQQSGEWAGHCAFPPQPWDDQTPEKLLASQQAVDAMQRAINLAAYAEKGFDPARCRWAGITRGVRITEDYGIQFICTLTSGT